MQISWLVVGVTEWSGFGTTGVSDDVEEFWFLSYTNRNFGLNR